MDSLIEQHGTDLGACRRWMLDDLRGDVRHVARRLDETLGAPRRAAILVQAGAKKQQSLASSLYEMRRSGVTDLVVVKADRHVHGWGAKLPDFDNRHLAVAEQPARCCAVREAGQDDSGGGPRQCRADQILLVVLLVLGVAEHHLQSLLAELVLQGRDSLSEERVADRWHDDAHDAR